MKKKGQVSLEFIMIFAFALIIFVLLLAVLMQFLESGRNTRILQEYEYVADSISRNLLIVAKGPGEVAINFKLPEKIANSDYEVKLDKTTGSIVGYNIVVVQSLLVNSYSVRVAIPEIDESSYFQPASEHIIRRDSDGDITVNPT